ncbi:putative Clavata3/esr-related 20 [Quillaja saponaria]|uniref:Clavata3/esr-related 20 n=1 Tax=Quillaja saponaria TaxID=32244 RepID=A0AAD7LLW2_QUISA|nr:putative Clavata3/esr-related 20 [Quillaja saponaria]
MNMNHFHFHLLVTLLLLFTPRNMHAIRTRLSSPSTTSQPVFRPRPVSAPFSYSGKDLYSEKRRVPTGSNPLHNKR